MQTNLEVLVAEILGPRYAGRRFLRYRELEELGLVDNRATLDLWIAKKAFPAGLKIPGPYGKTLVWHVPEVVRLIAQRLSERDCASPIPSPNTGLPIRDPQWGRV
jgi:predicted DNA-binding transcriptional regulator AlpA